MRADLQLAEQGRPAGFVSRLIAITIDIAILVAVITIITVVGQFLVDALGLGQATKRFTALLTAGFGVVLWIAYFVGLVAAGGQTIGKRVMGLRVVRTDGSRVTGRKSFKRFVGYIVSLPLFWGFLVVLVDNRRQAFQDHFADTFVIYFMPAEGDAGPLEAHLQAVLLKRRTRLATERAAIEAQERQAAAAAAAAQATAPSVQPPNPKS